MEDEDAIGLVLARATELRLKIRDSIERATTSKNSSPVENQNPDSEKSFDDFAKFRNFDGEASGGDYEEVDEEEAERLLHIHDALESLETQLSGLQNLQQRQQYEKQVALSEIDYSRKMLLEKLKQYNGKRLDVLQETSAFAGEKVEYENDLLLPPYPRRPPLSLVSDNGYISILSSKQKQLQKGNFAKEAKKIDLYDSTKTRKVLVHFLSSVAKVVLPIVGAISILSLTGFGPEFKKKGSSLKLFGLNPSRGNKETGSSVQCPLGRILVVENGEARCLVKERVEIPLESVAARRAVDYGYG